MVPELSRSADHLCQQKINEEADEDGDYFKGNLLKTPDYTTRGITPSVSMIASPGVSQWTVNESTTQTEGWHDRGDSFDSSKSYSFRSGNSLNHLNKHHRSRSVPSNRCAICKQTHHKMKPSESMHYATRTVTFQGKNFVSFCENSSHKLFLVLRAIAKDSWLAARPSSWLYLSETLCERPNGALSDAWFKRIDRKSLWRGWWVCASLRWSTGRRRPSKKIKSTMLWSWHSTG